ncbi:MAG TPA: 1-deoxy-D-xylulose-5-phosphate synthase N-terminal domain-containing protein [Elusimicrobiales bacterium]|nr:1-deoxy-D-xylulose-5-phosphate synthase N-terminal domain-containing protein [Elusimicrobiales bacterium]
MSAITPYGIRKIILEQSKRAHVGHIGSALSVADILAALYSGPLGAARGKDPERDRFILSKGHAALALYAALHLRGDITRAELDSFCGDGSGLGVHPESSLHCVDFSTGALGQGLSMAAGAALAARLQGSPRRVFALLSDGECNEGAVWEAALFAAHHKLENLTAIIDLNGQQAFGYTEEVLSMTPMPERWRAFNWEVAEVDGHDMPALAAALAARPAGRPSMIVARTVFGRGVPFMEGRIKWHYWPMSDAEYALAMAGLEKLK